MRIKISVNGLVLKEYFKRPTHQLLVSRPLEVSSSTNYDIKCSVKGGGMSGQAGAIILGISRALVNHDNGLKDTKKRN